MFRNSFGYIAALVFALLIVFGLHATQHRHPTAQAQLGTQTGVVQYTLIPATALTSGEIAYTSGTRKDNGRTVTDWSSYDHARVFMAADMLGSGWVTATVTLTADEVGAIANSDWATMTALMDDGTTYTPSCSLTADGVCQFDVPLAAVNRGGVYVNATATVTPTIYVVLGQH